MHPVHRFALSLPLLCAASFAMAADWPTRPIRIAVPFPAGGTSDLVARLYAEKLSTAFGQQVVVDNRPGAAGVVGGAYVVKQGNDGHTFLQAFVSHTINPYVYVQLPFDTEKDFVPVALVASSPNVVVVTPSLPVKSIRDLIDLARSRPGQINYASSGVGSNSHLSAEILSSMTGIRMNHVPYKGAPQANTEVAAGTVQVHIPSIPVTFPFIQSGRLKAIAVTSLKRSPVLPDVPVVADTVPGFETVAWDGLLAPRGVPQAVIDRMAAAIQKAMASPDVIKTLNGVGADPDFKGPQAFGAFLASEHARWRKAVQESGLKPGSL